jgi:hypothetical protein
MVEALTGNGDLVPDLWLSDALSDRIELSSGVQILDEKVCHELGYDSDSVIPTDTWRVPDRRQRAALFGIAKNYCPWSRGVSLGQASGELRRAAETIRRLGLASQAEANSFMKTRDFRRCAVSFEKLARSRSLFPTPRPRILGISVIAKDLITTTTDRNTGHQIGLHLDSWDGREFRARDLCRNRICLNLGEEDRFLLFCNVTISTIAMSLIDHSLHRESSRSFIRAFFDSFHQYPILRMRIAPNEYYIAPTENIIHDSTTLGKSKNDVAITALGYFRL